MTLFAILLGAILGAVGGSFLAAAFWRHSRGVAMEGRSVCSHCGEEIPSTLNIPIVSWLWLGGKARCCQQPLAKQDLLFEVLGLLLGASLGWAAGPLAPALATVLLLLIVFILDRRFR